MKEHTNAEGLNVISAFTGNGDFFRNHPKLTKNLYFKEGELKALYDGWEVLEYTEQESKARATNKDGSPMFNVLARILAKKPKN
jgi:hypothetical protein